MKPSERHSIKFMKTEIECLSARDSEKKWSRVRKFWPRFDFYILFDESLNLLFLAICSVWQNGLWTFWNNFPNFIFCKHKLSNISVIAVDFIIISYIFLFSLYFHLEEMFSIFQLQTISKEWSRIHVKTIIEVKNLEHNL